MKTFFNSFFFKSSCKSFGRKPKKYWYKNTKDKRVIHIPKKKGIVLGVLAYEPTLPLIVKNVRINHNIEKASKPIPKNK